MNCSMQRKCVWAALALFVSLLFVPTASSQTAFGNGNLVVLRVADRTLGSAQSVQIREYRPSTTSLGTAIQTIAIPSSSTDDNRFTISGSSTTGGNLSLNPNGTITFAGYRAAMNDPAPTITLSADVNRVIGSLDLSTGIVNTNISTVAFNNLHFRNVATADGVHFYLSGQSGSVQRLPAVQFATVLGGLPNIVTTIAATTPLVANTNNLTQIQVVNGNLFASSTTGTPGRSIHQIGTGLPTTTGQTLSASFPSQTATDQYNSFGFARLGAGTSWNNTGFDTIYAVDNDTAAGSTVQKWSFDGTTWNATGNISVFGANNITIRKNSAASIDLFVTTQTDVAATLSTIRAITDTSGFSGTLSGSFTTILTGTGNEGFLGIAYTPVPEPGTVLAISAATVALVGAVRRLRSGKRKPNME